MGLLSKAATKSDTPQGWPSGTETEIGAFLAEFQKTNVSFYCVVLRADIHAVCGMVKSVGEAADLGNGNCLVLLPLSVDRELAAHRLAKSLKAEILCQCEANSAETALTAIASCS